MHSILSCSEFLTSPTHYQTNFCNFICELEWQHHQSHELCQYNWQVRVARLKASLKLLLPPQVYNPLHHSQRCLYHHQKWSISDFKSIQLSCISIIYSLRRCDDNGHHILFSDFFGPLHKNCLFSCRWNLCDIHMMISDPQWWVNVLGKAWNNGSFTYCQFCFHAIPQRYFLDYFGRQASHIIVS